jgi:hypothetical protein
MKGFPHAKAPPEFAPEEIATLRIELIDTEPLIWREVEVPTSMTLKVLHDVIQSVMGWFDYHLWEFKIGGKRYGPSMHDDWGDEPRRDATKVRLREVLSQRRTRINYVYDFGDNWEIEIVASKVREGEAGAFYPRMTGGEWNAPPEDCGGLGGFYDLLEALADKKHPEHEFLSEHFDGYDPKEVDGEIIGHALLRIARARNGGRKRVKAA